jgi:hypothetical protein
MIKTPQVAELSTDPDNTPPRSRLFLVVPKTADADAISVSGAAALARGAGAPPGCALPAAQPPARPLSGRRAPAASRWCRMAVPSAWGNAAVRCQAPCGPRRGAADAPPRPLAADRRTSCRATRGSRA